MFLLFLVWFWSGTVKSMKRLTWIVPAAEKFSMGYIQAWCLPNVTLLSTSLVRIEWRGYWTYECPRSCGTKGGMVHDCSLSSVSVFHILYSLSCYSSWMFMDLLLQKHPGSLLEGFSQTQVSTLAVKDNLLVAGGFQGELICKVDHPNWFKSFLINRCALLAWWLTSFCSLWCLHMSISFFTAFSPSSCLLVHRWLCMWSFHLLTWWMKSTEVPILYLISVCISIILLLHAHLAPASKCAIDINHWTYHLGNWEFYGEMFVVDLYNHWLVGLHPQKSLILV